MKIFGGWSNKQSTEDLTEKVIDRLRRSGQGGATQVAFTSDGKGGRYGVSASWCPETGGILYSTYHFPKGFQKDPSLYRLIKGDGYRNK